MRLAHLLAVSAASAALLAPACARAQQPAPAEEAPPETTAPPVDTAPLEGRRRPGQQPELPPPVRQVNPGAVAPPPMAAFPEELMALPDRWRLIEAVGVKSRWWDPYNQNTYKADRPIFGTDSWFVQVNAISDTVVEPRSFPIPVGVQTTERPGSLDVFGRSTSLVFAQTFLVGAALIEGSTAYRPPDIELRGLLAFNFNYVDVPEKRVLKVQPSKASHRRDGFIGVQELFLDYHLRNVSDRYDFDSVRVGVQPFSSDFRGFLFQDNQLGVRLFGNRDNNRYQYNLAAFWRIEKDTNSGLNDVTQRLRDDFVFLGNVYRQDLPVVGFTSQAIVAYNRNREGNEVQIDHNGFPVRPALLGNLRPRDYDVVYVGYNGDGHWGRYNLTTSLYAAIGEDRNSVFTSRKAKIRAFFAAAEPSIDFDWIRVRGTALYASGDDNPYDNREKGFDAIFENPQFAGSDTSYWIRQTIPFAGGGRAIFVNTRNGLLNNLRSSKEEGQSNFNNPGTVILGGGVDADITAHLRLTGNLNYIGMATTAVVRAQRQEGSISRALGYDASVSAIYRPFVQQNIVFRLSGAVFQAEKGFKDLFTNRAKRDQYYSVLANLILTF